MVSVRETEWKTLDLNAATWGIFHVRHSSSCRSSWDILHGEFAFYQESVQEIIETVVSSDSEANH